MTYLFKSSAAKFIKYMKTTRKIRLTWQNSLTIEIGGDSLTGFGHILSLKSRHRNDPQLLSIPNADGKAIDVCHFVLPGPGLEKRFQ